MKMTYKLLIACMLLCTQAYADYSTPNTTVKWTLDDLVTNSGGNVTFSSGEYVVSGIITISANDTIAIATDAVVKFAAATHFLVKGALKVDPPNSVVFTAQVQSTGFNGIRFENSVGSVLRNLTLEYAVSCNITDSDPIIDSCIFQYNNVGSSTTFGNGAIAVFRSKAQITNTKFLNNRRAAIQGGSNVANPMIISNCIFSGNNTLGGNVPQINLGGSGADTLKILNNQFLAASTNSGAIGFLPTTDLHVLITGNLIQNNRYGINLQGGSLINAVVSYNIIEGNNTAGNPASGGSGIAFSGGSSTSHQNSIVTGNLIKGNLWGITIQNGAKPNLGNLSNADTTDDGKNWFYGNSNTNATTPGIHLYNNSPDDIMAQGNYWGSNDPVAVEASIFHKTDQNTLGLVDYSSNVLPVQLLSFNGSIRDNGILLSWKVASEINADRYVLERSNNGLDFRSIVSIAASGTSLYSHIDKDAAIGTTIYYRLKMIDNNGAFKYSQLLMLQPTGSGAFDLKLSSLSPGKILATITNNKEEKVMLKWYDATGKLLGTTSQLIMKGKTLINLDHTTVNSGIVFVEVITNSTRKTLPVLVP